MIYLSLFLEFLQIGLFAFGGAYGAIPLIKEVVLENSWMNEEMFSNMIAISESTPGPIMINSATYIGNNQAGILGALVATLGVVLPSFLIILLIVTVFHKFLKNNKVQMVLKGIKPCLMGVIIATGLYMLGSIIIIPNSTQVIEYHSLIILTVLIVISGMFYLKNKKEISPIWLIIFSAVMGCLIFG